MNLEELLIRQLKIQNNLQEDKIMGNYLSFDYSLKRS